MIAAIQWQSLHAACDKAILAASSRRGFAESRLRLKVSIALLTKNGGELLKECLDAVCSQRLAWPFEIVAIDSGSTDGSAEFLKTHSRVTYVSIPASEFQHGRTRNLVMRRAQSELVAFLTQDAVPASEDWLAQLVEFMDTHPEVAGAFGRQVAHAGADPLEAWEIAGHFETFTNRPPVFRAAPAGGEPAGEMVRASLHYFSNVNSCIRRQTWEQIPFPEIEFGEDQAWAFQVQQAGLATGYAERAIVRHSHAYGTLDLFRRRYDEARFMRRHFGYSLVASWLDTTRIARAQTASYRLHMDGLLDNPRTGTWRQAASRAWASSLGRFAGTRLANHDGLIHRQLSLTERNRRA
jgi:GT2 family glycosyltransferase